MTAAQSQLKRLANSASKTLTETEQKQRDSSTGTTKTYVRLHETVPEPLHHHRMTAAQHTQQKVKEIIARQSVHKGAQGTETEKSGLSRSVQ